MWFCLFQFIIILNTFHTNTKKMTKTMRVLHRHCYVKICQVMTAKQNALHTTLVLSKPFFHRFIGQEKVIKIHLRIFPDILLSPTAFTINGICLLSLNAVMF
jgi:uncharacterized membrane protein